MNVRRADTLHFALCRYHVGTENENVEYLGSPIGKPRKHEVPHPGKHSLTAEQRAALWNEIAPELSLQAAREALKNWKEGGAADITHVVTTNTSGWREPGIAAHLIHSLGLSLDTQKCELNFNGCFCGMTCLRLVRRCAKLHVCTRDGITLRMCMNKRDVMMCDVMMCDRGSSMLREPTMPMP